ncbi:epoxide hydrolase, soluble (sEH) [Coemansia sp. RSA 1939]|nr:epoxide hydrolase, soluble (sEH) [Coemansia sp. RSA 1939]KAJ2594864.1 epoxide hydrolase, soluble (sEH) [Coemansia sp. RSA 1804]
MSIPVNHDDFIHDTAYNFYGTRLATCGSDKCIKIWDWNKQTGLWILNESILAHESSVVRLSWAHPEFGQVLASCSLDRTVKIWMEHEPSAKAGGSRWTCVSKIVDSSGVVHSVAFAPEYTSLIVAAASSDGKVRLHSPIEAVKLRNWSISGQIDFVPGGASDSDGPLSLSWCKSRFSAPHMLVVGGSKGNAVRVYQTGSMQPTKLHDIDFYDSYVLDVDWAPTMGRSFHLIATACSDGHVRIYKFWADPVMSNTSISEGLFVHENDDGVRNASKATNTAANGGDLSADYDSEDDEEEEDEEDDDDDDDEDEDDDDDSDSEGTDSDDDDNGVDAEDSEQGGDGLDTANDGSDDDDDDDNGTYSNSNPANNPNASNARRRTRAQGRRSGSKALGSSEQQQLSYPRSELVADLVVEPHVPIRRVRWNSTGTLLSSSGDDGVARMWKMTVNGTWREVAAITAEKSSAEM